MATVGESGAAKAAARPPAGQSAQRDRLCVSPLTSVTHVSSFTPPAGPYVWLCGDCRTGGTSVVPVFKPNSRRKFVSVPTGRLPLTPMQPSVRFPWASLRGPLSVVRFTFLLASAVPVCLTSAWPCRILPPHQLIPPPPHQLMICLDLPALRLQAALDQPSGRDASYIVSSHGKGGVAVPRCEQFCCSPP